MGRERETGGNADRMWPTRRELLGGLAAGTTSAAAGCGAIRDGDEQADGTRTDETRTVDRENDEPRRWDRDVDADGHSLANLAGLDVERIATRSRAAAVVVWKDGETGTVYADGQERIAAATDASIVLQSAIDAATPGGTVYVVASEEPYRLGDTIELGESVTLTGGATLRRDHAGDLLVARDVDGCAVSELTILGNKSAHPDETSLVVVRDGCTDWTVSNLTVRNSPAQGIHAGGFEEAVERGRIVGNTVTGCDHRNVICDPRARDVRIAGNTMSGAGKANLLVGHGVSNIDVIGNVCREGGDQDSGVVVHNTASAVRVLGNTIADHESYGMRLMANAHDCQVGWNTIVDNGNAGIILRGHSQDDVYEWQSDGETRRNLVAFNTVHGNAHTGIELRRHGDDGPGASENVIYGNLVADHDGAGITEGEGGEANEIRDNRLRGNGRPISYESPKTIAAGNTPPIANARDELPSHAPGRTVLASAVADPDGDGNGEWVMSDGVEWQEIVDLPNFE